MKVREVMTEEVLTASPDTPLRQVAETLALARISGLPVTDTEGHVLGVVSEADLLALAAGERKGHPGTEATAGAAMSSPALVIRPEQSVAEAAKLMCERGVNRLPVVDADGTLVGIVTRADIVRAFARSDQEIERELREEVVVNTLWIDPADVWIEVRDGVVRLAGEVETKADAELLAYFASRVPGVVSVETTLRWRREKARLERSDPRVPAPPRR
jgi:CBS domain-containing protein